MNKKSGKPDLYIRFHSRRSYQKLTELWLFFTQTFDDGIKYNLDIFVVFMAIINILFPKKIINQYKTRNFHDFSRNKQFSILKSQFQRKDESAGFTDNKKK